MLIQYRKRAHCPATGGYPAGPTGICPVSMETRSLELPYNAASIPNKRARIP